LHRLVLVESQLPLVKSLVALPLLAVSEPPLKLVRGLVLLPP
jgi:hypothetical protein